jgi:hypothetical protein
MGNVSSKLKFLGGQSRKLKYLLLIVGTWAICKYINKERQHKKMLDALRSQALASISKKRQKVGGWSE